MGIKDLFKRANLTSISNDPDLHVDNILHQSFLEVNEEGSEAAGATGKKKK